MTQETRVETSDPSIAELRASIKETLDPASCHVTRGHDGAITIRVLSDRFEGSDNPIEVLRSALHERGIELPKRVLTILRAPSEVDESEQALFEDISTGIPTWADALLLDRGETSTRALPLAAKVVAFWGVKGGVGRTTALAHVATLLGKRTRTKVLAVDLDLDSPGLVATLADPTVAGGRVERFDDLLSLALESGNDAALKQAVGRALLPGKDGSARVEVLGQRFADSQFVRNLVGRLTPSSIYRLRGGAVRRLLRAAIEVVEADIVLLDARAGYSDESAMCVLDLADEIAFFVSPAPTVFSSLAPAVEALERCRIATGRPQLVHYIASMLPASVEVRTRIVSELVSVLYEARATAAQSLNIKGDELPPDISPVTVDYSARIVENDGRLILNAVNGYVELADRIMPPKEDTPVPMPEGWVAAVLRGIRIPVGDAESAEDASDLAELFTSIAELHQFVRHEVTIVKGAKGTGKTYLLRMCLEHRDLLVARTGIRSLENVIFVNGYAQPQVVTSSSPPVTPDLIQEIDAIVAAKKKWSVAWSALALGRVLSAMAKEINGVPRLLKSPQRAQLRRLVTATTTTEVLGAVKKLLASPLLLDEVWADVNELCERSGKTITLLFDGLDVVLGNSAKLRPRRDDLIRGLLERMGASWENRRSLSAKLFIREDIFRGLGLEEEAKYASRSVTLSWQPDEIWLLVIRAVAVGSREFDDILSRAGIQKDHLEDSSEEQRYAALRLIWGDRLGQSEEHTRSTVWAERRLHDGKGRMFPRAALWLLKYALEERRRKGADGNPPLLDAAALRAAMPAVARERLAELKAECSPSERRLIDSLQGFDNYQNDEDFHRELKKKNYNPIEVTQTLATLGVIERGSRQDKTPTVRIVDLYAFAAELKVKRLGRR